MNEYQLWYYRTDQAGNLDEALKDGAVRKHTLDGPSESLDEGCAADAMELILQGADMMQGGVKIGFHLIKNEKEIDTLTWSYS